MFQDLIVCLARLQEIDAKGNAEWTMLLINGKESDRAQFHVIKPLLKEKYLVLHFRNLKTLFNRSIYLLAGIR